MPVAVACTACNTALEIDLEHIGWRVRCPKCDAVFLARSSSVSPPTAGGGAPSPYAQTWTPPAGWTGPASPPPSPPAPPAPAPLPSPAAAGSFNDVFGAPIAAPPGAPIAKGARGALVLGILSIACFHLLTGIPAVIVGYKARHRIRASGGQLAGDNLALAGIIMGTIGILLTLTDGWAPWSLTKLAGKPFTININDDESPRKVKPDRR